MKKIIVILLSILMLMGVSACSKKDELSSDLQTYKADGISIKMPAGLKNQQKEGEEMYDMFYGNDNFAMTISRQDKQLLITNGYMSEGEGVDKFADVLTELTGFTFEKNSSGVFVSKYDNTVNGTDFSYFSSVRDGKDCFWIIDFFCMAEDASTYYPQFEAWDNTVVVE